MADSNIDLDSLSESQQLALQQFTAVTDQEPAAALPLLQKCQWNAQIAITRFFDGDAETVDPVAEAARAAPPPTDPRRTESLVDTIRRPSSTPTSAHDLAPRVVPTPESQRVQSLPLPITLLFLPFNLAGSLLSRIFSIFSHLFPFLPRLLARFRTTPSPRRRPLNSTDTAARFAREFEEEYNSTLPFHPHSYAHAFDQAKREAHFLLVLLLSPEHDDTAPFVRNTLLSPEFSTFLSSHSDVIFWAGSVQDSEAYQIASALHATRFPYLALIAHTPAASVGTMSKIVTTSGPMEATELVGKLEAGMEERREEMTRVRAQRAEVEAGRNLRREQESAYEVSLARDREKARRRAEEEREKERVEKEEREKQEKAEERKRLEAQWRRWRAKRVDSEPGADVKSVVRISLRMMSGERVVRKFRAEAELEELYAFVECWDLLEDVAQEEKAAEQPEGYEHKYGFRLVSPMPREVYELDSGGTLGAKIGRSGNLIVEKIIDEEDEEEEEELEE